MKQSPRVARPGDVCILLEPDVNEIPRLRWLQRELQTSFGGRMQERVHFTCQRFELPDAGQLPPVMQALQTQLAALAPFPVLANCLQLVEHPFWEFCVLHWDVDRTAEMWRFAHAIDRALAQAGMAPHYPCGDGWRPHVTALEAIASPNGHGVNGTHRGQLLYTARRVVLSQVLEGKRFEILAAIELQSKSAFAT